MTDELRLHPHLRAELRQQAREQLLAAVQLLERSQVVEAIVSTSGALLLLTGSMPEQIAGELYISE